MIARRFTLTAMAMLCVPVFLLALASVPASALVTHYYLPALTAKFDEGIPAEGPHGEKVARSGPLELGNLSMTFDSGHLWAVEGNDRIDEFDAATGSFISQLATRPEEVFFGVGNSGSAGIAVGHLGGKAQVYVGEGTSTGAAVGVYGETGTLDATWTGAATPAGSFLGAAMDVAVDDSTNPLDERKGDVYVASTSPLSGVPDVIDVFRPEADGQEHYLGQIKSSEPLEGPIKVAVDNTNGDVVVVANKSVYVFEPAALGEYVLIRKISGSPGGPFHAPFNLSVDEVNGDIYIDDLVEGEGPGDVIDQFSSTGAYLGRITGVETPHGRLGFTFAVAVDPVSHNVYVGNDAFDEMDVFGPDIVFPDVATEGPSGVTPFSATLNGTVNPQSAGAATCRFEWGTGKSFGKTAPCEPEAVANGGGSVPVHATLNGLQSDTTYFYRLQATNGNGTNPGEASQDQEFTTPGPGIREASVTDLASTSVTFDASINPHKVTSSVYFQYGSNTSYGTNVPASPGEAIGSGEDDVEVTPHHVQGLQASTVYHYRVVVVTEPKPSEVIVFDGPDQIFTTQTDAVAELPDGRQWEMVSPPDKKGALIQPIEESGVVRAADGGNAISYLVDTPTETEAQGSANEVQTLSTRGPGGWSTRDISLPHNSEATGTPVGTGYEYKFFSEDLSEAVVQPSGGFVPGLSAEASESTAMLRTLGSCTSSCYRPLVTGKLGFANVPPGTVFGQEPNGKCEVVYCGPKFVGATADLSHVVVAVEGGGTGGKDLGQFEWTAGKLTPIEILPDGTQGNLTFGGGDNPRNAISRDGSHVVMTQPVSGNIYMRDLTLEKTVQLNVAEPACAAEGKCASGGGEFQLASDDGSRVFFTNGEYNSQSHRLTKGSGEVGSDLYECEMVEKAGDLECKLTDIGKETLGVLGGSEDGSYIYFVANSVLAQGAIPGECVNGVTPPPAATCNLYLRHDGVTKLVAELSGEDTHDWTDQLIGSSARVSPDGKWAEFMSQRSVTGYDNRDAVNGKPEAEVYLYDASTGRVVCASCDPTGARPIGAEYRKLEPGGGGLTGGPRGVWNTNGWVAANVPGWVQYRNSDSADQPRYLSDSGRLFFNSGDALVPQDVNGTQDVYEYEPAGVGSCMTASATFDERAGGCVELISSGTSAEESAFLEASENGGDVFFLTYSKLQPQDYDNAVDIYDAHECTSASPCFPTPVPQPPACTTADACRAAPTPQPASFGAPSSATFSGAGNIAPGSGGVVTKKALTRTQKLASALKACKRKAKQKRARCEKDAKARYGQAKPGKATAKKGKR